MKIYDIPLIPAPSQRLSVNLGGQAVDIALTVRLGRLYADVKVGGAWVVGGRVCLNKEPVVREAFRGFSGELYFEDLRGNDDPVPDGLGSRFVLRWAHGA